MVKLRVFYKKVVLGAAAFMLALANGTAVMPFILSSQVDAAPNSQYSAVGFGGLTWSPDRAAPSGGYDITPSSLTLRVNSALSPVPSTFYLTEGLNAELPAGNNSVKASLFIDPDWQTKPVRAGLWGVSANGSDTAWPLIEFTNNYPGVGFNGLRVWDTNTGDWYNISTPAYGSTVVLEVAINPWTGNYEFYVGNDLVKTYSTEGYTALKGIIFNNRNSATGNAADNYSVVWSNLQTGVRQLAAPTNLQPMNGTSTSNNGFSMSWNTVEYATKYQYRTSHSLADTTTLGPIAYSDDSSSANYTVGPTTVTRGNSGTPEGMWYWQVRAGDDLGNWGPWSGISLVTTDYTAPAAPTLNGPADNAIVNGASLTQSWNASASSDVDHYVYESYTDAGAHNLRWNQTVHGLSKTATNVADSTFWWRVKAVDAAGNESDWSPLWTLTVDSTVPAAPTLVTPDWYIANGSTKQLKWNASASSDVVSYEYAEYNNVAPASDTTPPSWVKPVLAPATQTTDTAWGSDIKIFWRVRAVDAAGNKSAWSETRTIITDRTKPTATIDMASVAVGNTLNVQVTGQDALSGVARIAFNLYDATNTTKVANLKTVDFTAHSGSEVSTLSGFDLSGLPSGTYVVRAAVRDVAGNLSNYALQTITIDTDAPTLTFDSAVNGGTTPTFTGTIDDPTAAIVITVGTSIFSATNNGDGTWTFTVPGPLSDGTYVVSAEATDAAGNTRGPVVAPSYTVTTVVSNTPESTPTVASQQAPVANAVVPNIIGPAATAQVLGDSTVNSGGVTPDEDVKGTETVAKVADDLAGWSLFGLAWYWWLIIVAAVLLLTWWLVAGMRRRQQDN